MKTNDSRVQLLLQELYFRLPQYVQRKWEMKWQQYVEKKWKMNAFWKINAWKMNAFWDTNLIIRNAH